VSRPSAASLLLLVSLLAVAWAGTGQAATLERTLSFPSPEIGLAEGAATLSVADCPLVGLPGEPLLPARGLCVLLPQGEDVSAVRIDLGGATEIILDAPLQCAQQQYPLSWQGSYQRTLPDEQIYTSVEPFPAERAVLVTTEAFRGYRMAFIRVYPATYVGARSALAFASTIRVTLETQPSSQALTESVRMLRPGNQRDLARLEGIAGDVSEAQTYQARLAPQLLSSLVNGEDSYPYVIITNSTLKPVFENLRDLKDEQGYKTKIVLVSDISANYSGSDLQAKIRNFIIDAYQNWETEFVLLGGDNDIIPHRGLYADAGGTIDNDIAADLYYMGLDGNWNTDGDSHWGEPAEADLIPEVSCGRAAVGTTTEAGNFVNKMIKYERTPVVAQVHNALMAGELLWDDPTWGGDYKDEIKDGSSNYGYTTVGFPGTFSVSTLYDRDIYPYSWDKEDLIPLINGGNHIINHLGHSSTTYGLRMVNSDVDTRFTNNGVSNTYNIIYSQGCYAASFDNRTSDGTYTEDCIAEHFCFVANAAVAFVGNTRYGWGAHASTGGASQYYDRQFFDAIFGEGITQIGPADVDSRVDNIPFIDATSPGRWVYYELVVLGDPAMDIWTDSPDSLTAEYPATIYVGQNQVAVRVLGSGPIEGARVAIFTDSTYSCSYTNASGYAYIDPKALQTGQVSLAVSAHNFYAYEDEIDVVNAGQAFLILEDFPVDDDSAGGSSGNANGGIDAGETIESLVTLHNIGAVTATDVEAELSCDNQYVSLLDSTTSCPSIGPGGQEVAAEPFLFEVDPQTPDGEMLDFAIQMSCADTVVTGHVSFATMAPLLTVGDFSYYDSVVGNNNGCIEPGERFELNVIFVNYGSGDAEDVTLHVSSTDLYVTVFQDSSYLANVPSGSQGETSPSFVIGVSPGCPVFHQFNLSFSLDYGSGRQASASATLSVGGVLSDDMEAGAGPWTHQAVNEGFVDEWHLESYRNHTGGGAYSWKCGGAGSANYSDMSNGALVTPELCLGPDATLSFWHYMDAEIYSGNPPYAWDGGIVEISTDGGSSWNQITPEGGYPHLIYPNSASPFDSNTPCYAATSGWEQETFDLSLYTGAARIRFQFGSDGYVTEEGWYIDDVEVTADVAVVHIDPDDLEPVPAVFALRMEASNPVVSGLRVGFDVPRRSPVSIGLFDVTGRSVGTLVDSVMEPGRYSQQWDTGRLSPGVYFLRMTAPDFEKATKVVNLR
jgi:hypothetical protein